MPHPSLPTLFQNNSHINPIIVDEAVRTLIRATPLEDPNEPEAWAKRRMFCTLHALGSLRPRDDIELMLGVQALCAYLTAAACWRIGMNARLPRGDSTRHIATAATAARAFDSLLKALERRQAKPLLIPPGCPEPRIWPDLNPTEVVDSAKARCQQTGPAETPDPEITWDAADLDTTEDHIREAAIAEENKGLDIANTDGIRPDGSIIMPEHPTPQQDAYIARRLWLAYQRETEENTRKGLKNPPEIRGIRAGDLIP